MADAVKIEVQGVADVLSYFNSAKITERRAAEKAAGEAAKEVRKFIVQGVPTRFRKSVKAKVFKGNKNLVGAKVGMYTGYSSGHQDPGYTEPIDDWLKAYWLNYGTMASRDKSHSFDRAVKDGKENKHGIEPRRFFETAIYGWEEVFMRKFNEVFNQQEL